MTNDTGKGKEGKATAPRSPLEASTLKPASGGEAKAAEEPAQAEVGSGRKVRFLSHYLKLQIWLVQPEIRVEQGVKKRRPKFKVQFENGIYDIDPDRVFEAQDIKMTGKNIIEGLRTNPMLGNTFFEFKSAMGKTEDIPSVVKRLQAMSDAEVRNDARNRGMKVNRSMNKEAVILAIISKEMGDTKI